MIDVRRVLRIPLTLREERSPALDNKGDPAEADMAAREAPGRSLAGSHDPIVDRDKCSLDMFLLKDESLEDSANLPEPHVLAEEIADEIRSALERIENVFADLQQRARSG